jgi:phosphoenolpyruvate carboxykinase (ATP)
MVSVSSLSGRGGAAVTGKNESLQAAGFSNLGDVHWNLPTPALVEEAVLHDDGMLSHLGPFVVRTGQYTGRTAGGKFIVADPATRERVWWSDANQPLLPEKYKRLKARVLAYLQCRRLYVQELYLGADERHRVSLRFITETPWHALFARNMFIQEPDRETLERLSPEYTLIHVPNFRAIPEIDGTLSDVFVILNFPQREILIGGTAYGGTIKKAAFTLMNYLLPPEGVLPLHGSANYGKDESDVALFVGLSGTGKTTLAVAPGRTLVADDTLGWGSDGIFNLEGGCYAKALRLSRGEAPEIHRCTRAFGTILENVAIHPVTRRVDLDDASLTENTRAAFPLSHFERVSRRGRAGHPRAIFLLAGDPFGILPPIARLSPEQAVHYFLLGYTAKVPGTEHGILEPQATFSPCLAAPFLALSPAVYASMLWERVRERAPQVWLLNTGWIGGPHFLGDPVGLPHTRAMVRAALDGSIPETSLARDPIFGFAVPSQVQGVPAKLLSPRTLWKGREGYDRAARELARRFTEAFGQLDADLPAAIRNAGPGVGA